jgi:hypothetical protein
MLKCNSNDSEVFLMKQFQLIYVCCLTKSMWMEIKYYYQNIMLGILLSFVIVSSHLIDDWMFF